MQKDNKNSSTTIQEETIEQILIKISRKLLKNRMLIIKTISFFIIIGIIVALISPTVYESQTTFVPQTSDQNSSNTKGYAQLASLAGINLNSESISSLDNYISPLLYSKIIESDEFSLDLLGEELVFMDGSKLSIREYILSSSNNTNTLGQIIGSIYNYSISLFTKSKKVKNFEKEILTDYNFISEHNYKTIQIFKQKFSIELNKREGYVKVLAYDRNAFISAQLVKIVTKNLQSRIISLRTSKIKEQLDYSKELYTQKKDEFEKLQMTLAEFRDSNKNISTAVFLSELQMLQSEFDLQKGILTSLASEYNSNKIKLNKDTPIFSVLDEVSIPNARSKPKRKKIVLIFGLVGMFFSIIYTITKEYLIEIIQQIKKD